MTPNLSKYAGKTILVSIPALSGDIKCRPYILNGIELIGLWLEGDHLSSGFLTDEHRSHASLRWSFFVPFTQIACVAVGHAGVAAQTSTGQAPPVSAPTPQAASSGRSSTASGDAPKKPKSK